MKKKTPTKKKVTKKKKEIYSEVTHDGFALPGDMGQDYPLDEFSHITGEGENYQSVPPVELTRTNTHIDDQFYTKNYEITATDKKILAELTSKKAFRTFEKYIDWRVNAAAHRMKNLLIANEPEKAQVEAAEVNALVRVTQDMFNFWQEVKVLEKEDDILLKDKQSELKRVFGEDKYDIQFGQ